MTAQQPVTQIPVPEPLGQQHQTYKPAPSRPRQMQPAASTAAASSAPDDYRGFAGPAPQHAASTVSIQPSSGNAAATLQHAIAGFGQPSSGIAGATLQHATTGPGQPSSGNGSMHQRYRQSQMAGRTGPPAQPQPLPCYANTCFGAGIPLSLPTHLLPPSRAQGPLEGAHPAIPSGDVAAMAISSHGPQLHAGHISIAGDLLLQASTSLHALASKQDLSHDPTNISLGPRHMGHVFNMGGGHSAQLMGGSQPGMQLQAVASGLIRAGACPAKDVSMLRSALPLQFVPGGLFMMPRQATASDQLTLSSSAASDHRVAPGTMPHRHGAPQQTTLPAQLTFASDAAAHGSRQISSPLSQAMAQQNAAPARLTLTSAACALAEDRRVPGMGSDALEMPAAKRARHSEPVLIVHPQPPSRNAPTIPGQCGSLPPGHMHVPGFSLQAAGMVVASHPNPAEAMPACSNPHRFQALALGTVQSNPVAAQGSFAVTHSLAHLLPGMVAVSDASPSHGSHRARATDGRQLPVQSLQHPALPPPSINTKGPALSEASPEVILSGLPADGAPSSCQLPLSTDRASRSNAPQAPHMASLLPGPSASVHTPLNPLAGPPLREPLETACAARKDSQAAAAAASRAEPRAAGDVPCLAANSAPSSSDSITNSVSNTSSLGGLIAHVCGKTSSPQSQRAPRHSSSLAVSIGQMHERVLLHPHRAQQAQQGLEQGSHPAASMSQMSGRLQNNLPLSEQQLQEQQNQQELAKFSRQIPAFQTGQVHEEPHGMLCHQQQPQQEGHEATRPGGSLVALPSQPHGALDDQIHGGSDHQQQHVHMHGIKASGVFRGPWSSSTSTPVSQASTTESPPSLTTRHRSNAQDPDCHISLQASFPQASMQMEGDQNAGNQIAGDQPVSDRAEEGQQQIEHPMISLPCTAVLLSSAEHATRTLLRCAYGAGQPITQMLPSANACTLSSPVQDGDPQTGTTPGSWQLEQGGMGCASIEAGFAFGSAQFVGLTPNPAMQTASPGVGDIGQVRRLGGLGSQGGNETGQDEDIVPDSEETRASSEAVLPSQGPKSDPPDPSAANPVHITSEPHLPRPGTMHASQHTTGGVEFAQHTNAAPAPDGKVAETVTVHAGAGPAGLVPEHAGSRQASDAAAASEAAARRGPEMSVQEGMQALHEGPTDSNDSLQARPFKRRKLAARTCAAPAGHPGQGQSRLQALCNQAASGRPLSNLQPAGHEGNGENGAPSDASQHRDHASARMDHHQPGCDAQNSEFRCKAADTAAQDMDAMRRPAAAAAGEMPANVVGESSEPTCSAAEEPKVPLLGSLQVSQV